MPQHGAVLVERRVERGVENLLLSKIARRWLGATPGWVPNITFSARQPE